MTQTKRGGWTFNDFKSNLLFIFRLLMSLINLFLIVMTLIYKAEQIQVEMGALSFFFHFVRLLFVYDPFRHSFFYNRPKKLFCVRSQNYHLFFIYVHIFRSFSHLTIAQQNRSFSQFVC